MMRILGEEKWWKDRKKSLKSGLKMHLEVQTLKIFLPRGRVLPLPLDPINIWGEGVIDFPNSNIPLQYACILLSVCKVKLLQRIVFLGYRMNIYDYLDL